MSLKSLAFALLLCLSPPMFAAALLPGYGAQNDQTSVSGLSSGGFMATQFHVAYSSELVGAAVIAGGPYFCAGSSSNPFQSYLYTAATSCMNPCQWAFWPFTDFCLSMLLPDGEALVEQAQEFASEGIIDSPEHLTNDRIYLFSGGQDETVITPVVDQAAAFYRAAGVADANIAYEVLPAAQHAFISDNTDTPCGAHAPPYINNCNGYDQARALLEHIYGPLKPNAQELSGTTLAFDQAAFVKPDQFASSGLAEQAFAYIPKACESAACRIHIALHGCRQSAAEFATNKVLFRELSGYNEVADSNQIIILYPQIRARSEMQISPYNPRGCWDFWGYTNSDFYHKGALQMSAIRAMVEQLKQPRR